MSSHSPFFLDFLYKLHMCTLQTLKTDVFCKGNIDFIEVGWGNVSVLQQKKRFWFKIEIILCKKLIKKNQYQRNSYLEILRIRTFSHWTHSIFFNFNLFYILQISILNYLQYFLLNFPSFSNWIFHTCAFVSIS